MSPRHLHRVAGGANVNAGERQATPAAAEPDPRRLDRDELIAYLRGRTTVSVPFAGACCGISRSASYAAGRDGSLKTLRLGHRLLCPTTWLESELGLTAGEGVACCCADADGRDQ